MAEHQIPLEEAKSNLLSGAAYLAENIKSAEGHAQAMQIIVPFYVGKDDVDLAAALADTVDDPFTRDKLLTLTAEKCAALGDDEYALQLAEAVEDQAMQEAARERIALQKSAKGETEKALEIVENLPHPDFAFAGIAVNLYEQGEGERAFQMLEKIEFPSAQAGAFQAIAANKLQKDESGEAAAMLEKASTAADEIEHREEKLRVLTEIANHFLEANRKDKAIELFDKVKTQAEKLDNIYRDSFLTNASLGFLRAGSLDLADRTLDLVADKTQISSCLTGFAQEFWKRDERDEALETIEEAYAILKSQRDKETRDSRARFALFGSIALQFAQFEKQERAIEIAQEITGEEQRYQALSSIAQVLVLQKKDELAGQALQAIDEDGQRLFALVGMADAKNQLGEKEEAVKLLDEAVPLVETVPQFTVRAAVFNALAQRFAKFGKAEKAREAAHANFQIILKILDESSQVTALANLGEVFQQNNFELNSEEKQLLETLLRRAEF